MRVELSEPAESNLSEIYDYLQAEFSPASAAWFRGLQQTIGSLGDMPYRGKPVRSGSKERRLLYGRKHNIYLIVYRLNARQDTILVTRVIHGRTKKASRLRA